MTRLHAVECADDGIPLEAIVRRVRAVRAGEPEAPSDTEPYAPVEGANKFAQEQASAPSG